jgi:hypothetical protein
VDTPEVVCEVIWLVEAVWVSFFALATEA